MTTYVILTVALVVAGIIYFVIKLKLKYGDDSYGVELDRSDYDSYGVDVDNDEETI